MSIENPTLAHFRHFIRRGGFNSLFTLSHLYICRERSTNQLFYGKQTQFPKSQMNVSIFSTKDYENKSNWTLGQSKPNSNPIKPNFKRAKMNVNLYVIEDYRKKDDFAVRKNKPNSNPISEKPKMNANVFATKDYENITTFRLEQNKPNQTQCRNNYRSPSCSGRLFINWMKRKQSQKDFPDFFEKLPVMILTNVGK